VDSGADRQTQKPVRRHEETTVQRTIGLKKIEMRKVMIIGADEQPPRQQAPHASFAEPGVHASAAAELPPSGQEKVARNQPAAYLKILALLVPREMKLEHSGGVKAMSDEEIEQAIEAIQTMLAARAGEAAKVIEGMAEPAALPAPEAQSIGAGLEPKGQRRPNRLLMQADTAVGPRERKPRKREGGEDE